MNKDSKLIFEAYKLVNELDIGTDWAGGPSAPFRKNVAARHKEGGDVYLINAIAKGLNISVDEAADIFTSALFPHLFVQVPGKINGKEVGYTNPAKNEDAFRADIVKAIGKAIVDIQKQHPELKIPKAEAQKVYTSRLISNLSEFYKDYAQGAQGVVAPVGGISKVKKAVKKADPASTQQPATAEPAAPSNQDVYVINTMARFIPEFQKVFAEMPDQFVVKKGESLYKSKQFTQAVDDAIMQATRRPEEQAELKKDIADIISSIEFKQGYTLKELQPKRPGADSGEIETLGDTEEDKTPTEILQGRGMFDKYSGFDEFDRHSSY